MAGTTISGTVTQTVILARHGNARSPLTITDTGLVAPTAYGTDGIDAPATVHDARITNNGRVFGASGGTSLAGGTGIDFLGSGHLTNTGTLAGGTGGASATTIGYAGGTGVILTTSGHIANTGKIAGGTGGYGYNAGGTGGIAASLQAGTLANAQGGTISGGLGGGAYSDTSTGGTGGIGVVLSGAATLINHGAITGGEGGYIYGATDGLGGVGVQLQGGMITNTGSISGGSGGDGNYAGRYSIGGTGIQIQGGMLMNTGTVRGGASGLLGYSTPHGPGATGIALDNGTVVNKGLITGASGAYGHFDGGNGGVGIYMQGGSLTNDAAIRGGNGGSGGEVYAGNGNAGLIMQGGTVINNGSITAGSFGGGRPLADSGATAVQIDSSISVLTNNGTITGGDGIVGLAGGIGVSISVGTLVNAGLIMGGTGGSGYYHAGYGAQGGAGLVTSANVINTGIIIGGTGGTNAIGGTGVIIGPYGFGTLTNSGTIAGGRGGPAGSGNAPRGDAVTWAGGGTLVIDPGAVFIGTVDAGYARQDAISLGAGDGTLSGLGTQFLGVTNLAVQAQSDWQLAGANTLTAESSSLQVNGGFFVTGTLRDAGTLTVAQNGQAATYGDVQLGSVALDGGELLTTAGGTITIGARPGGTADAVTVEAHAQLTGFGRLDPIYVIDNGTITAQGGELDVLAQVSGTGTLAVSGGGTLLAGFATTVANLHFGGPGTLILDDPASVTGTISGFAAGDVIDVVDLAAKTLAYNDGTLTLSRGGMVLDTLYFSGAYTASDFALQTDHNGGTDVVYAGTREEMASPWFLHMLALHGG